MWNQITVEDCLTFPVNMHWFQVLVLFLVATKDCRLIHGTHLDNRKNVFGNQFSTFDSSRDHPQRIQSDDVQRELLPRNPSQGMHCAIPRKTDLVLEVRRSKTMHTSDDRQNQDTIPMSTFATRPWTMSSTIPMELLQKYMVGQQRQQISELQLDKFANPLSFLAWKIRFTNQVTTCSDFPSDAMLWIKEVENGRFNWAIEVVAISLWKGFSKLRDASREDWLCSEQDHPEFPVQKEG